MSYYNPNQGRRPRRGWLSINAPYSCSHCNEEFTSKDWWANHEPECPYRDKCETCGKSKVDQYHISTCQTKDRARRDEANARAKYLRDVRKELKATENKKKAANMLAAKYGHGQGEDWAVTDDNGSASTSAFNSRQPLQNPFDGRQQDPNPNMEKKIQLQCPGCSGTFTREKMAGHITLH